MSEQPLTVEDRAQIDDLFARYAWALDRGDDDAFAAVFTDVATFEDPSGRYTGPNAPYEIMAAMRANTTFPGRQHWIGQLDVDGTDQQATARSFVMVTSRLESGSTLLHLLAAYFDQLVKVDGQWRIAERLAKPWRADLLGNFPEIKGQPDWARAQQAKARS